MAPVIDTPAPLLNDDVVFDDTATNTLSDTTSAGSVTTGNQMLSELDFVNGLDNVQITLDLASRYIELGEHDSAKRLLDEVLATGSQEQKQNAQTLLSRIA